MVAIADIATNSIVALVIAAMTYIVAIDYIATKYCVERKTIATPLLRGNRTNCHTLCSIAIKSSATKIIWWLYL